MSLRNYLLSITEPAVKTTSLLDDEIIQFDIPQQISFGDFSTNIALLLAKKGKTNPRQLAQKIVDAIKFDDKIISKIEIAGPGFINFFY